MRSLILLAACVAMSGCTVRLHGHETTAGGVRTTVTSGAVAGSLKTGNARLAIAAGQPVSPQAPGGHVKLSGDAAAVLVVGAILIDAARYVAAQFSEPLPRDHDVRGPISHTCSCYGYRPALHSSQH